MEKKWYIIQLVAGYEEKVKEEILKRVQESDKTAEFGDILIPEVKNIQQLYQSIDTSSMEQLFPGYMVISVVPSIENFRLVKTIYRVIRFLGGDYPAELKSDEVNRIFSQMSGKIAVETTNSGLFAVGDHVEIMDGPFSKFSGTVDVVDDERKKLIVTISIFNRLTPIEISFHQVKK
jgi:transcriptional antiterminator NusG